ncbi:hypothetical protein [Flavobacterium hercynium]|uniref:Uncharacterized protein n=1 Tax=Flavobacterium hercynium TaxID=387094 RepID=A0A226HHQ0_9FLAO|nr:hypothetical protein [Flavobacterium hercynium]OXA93797.1 hypothetical protein B0A66_05980 [Flavobacterium hercynium]SMP20355.1 hypothetical protein SAMN06265346_106167 [Flavobacterium hercynium]
MKNFTILSLFFFLSTGIYAQNFMVKINGQEYDVNNIPPDTKFSTEVKTFEVKKIAVDNPAKTFTINNNSVPQSFATDGAYHSVTFPADIRGSATVINNQAGRQEVVFLLEAPETITHTNGNVKIIMPADKSATDYILNNLFKGMINLVGKTGLKLKEISKNEYKGPNYVHVFFDQNGNSLIRSIPLGISNYNYVVHVVYMVPADNPLNIEYGFNQATADLDEGVTIRGDGDLKGNAITLAGGETGQTVVKMEWRHKQELLTPSSYDITFDITRNSLQFKNGIMETLDPKVVATRVIRMKRIYHGSIDIGVIKTNLEDPTYSLTASSTDASQMVVKKTDQGSRVLASAMYTFYLSPVILLEKLFRPDLVRDYQIEGRSFVDDHRIYERIYPTVGIGLSNRLLDNIFLGGKWEFIRGGSLFVGYHWGKVNVFRAVEDFEYEITPITQAEFNLKTDTEWQGGFSAGLNLDLRIITNLFKTGTSTAQ